MEIKYNVMGARRKEMVSIISRITEVRAEYKGAPSFGYQIGDFTVDRNGTLIFDDLTDLKLSKKVIDELENQGFNAEQNERAEILETTETEQVETEEQPSVEFSTPFNQSNTLAIENFIRMLYSKQYLINKALGTEVIKISEEVANMGAAEILTADIKGIKFSHETITFEYPKADEKLNAYTDLLNKVWKVAVESKKMQAKYSEPENEKYYFRAWLVRIGLGGNDGAETRKALLKNLKGHSAFRTQADIEKAKQKYIERKSTKPTL